jgi:hypothetical protein
VGEARRQCDPEGIGGNARGDRCFVGCRVWGFFCLANLASSMGIGGHALVQEPMAKGRLLGVPNICFVLGQDGV